LLSDLLDFQEKARIIKVVSGGQTGADRAGLVAAKECGVETGGYAPNGYRTQTGSDYTLRDEFGLLEHKSPEYPPRTEANVRSADVTLIFGNENSPGCSLTKKYCRKWNKPYFVVNNMTTEALSEIENKLRQQDVFDITINVAGNREVKNPGIFELTRSFMTLLITNFNE
jgi:hypothetical protein